MIYINIVALNLCHVNMLSVSSFMIMFELSEYEFSNQGQGKMFSICAKFDIVHLVRL